MKRLLLLLAFLAGAAQAVAPDKLAIGTEPVVDQAGMLAPADAAALNEKLRTLHEAQVMQGAVVLVDNLGGMSDFDYGMAVFKRWQLGDRTRNDGLLILLSEKEHAIRIITGRGIEGDIPDAFAKKVINGMVPSFKQGRFAAGLNKGVDEIAARLQTDPAERLALVGHTDDAGHTADAFSETTGMLTFLLTFVAACLRTRPRVVLLALAGGGFYLTGHALPQVLTIVLAAYIVAGALRGIVQALMRGESGGGGSDDDDSGGFFSTGSRSSFSSFSSSSSSSSSDYSGGGGDSAGGGAGGTW